MNSIFDTQYSFVQILWILIFILLFSDINRRTKKKVVPEWDINFSINHGFHRGLISTLSKLFSTINSKTPNQISEYISIELCKNAGIAHKTSIFKFLKIRQNPEELKKYFTNRELIMFLNRPDIWTNTILLKEKRFFSWRKQKEISIKYMKELEKILDIFSKELIDHTPIR